VPVVELHVRAAASINRVIKPGFSMLGADGH
jgi:hypothetical protein